MDEITTFSVEEQDAGTRLDTYLSRCLPDMSRNALQHLCTEGCVTCGDKILAKNYKVRHKDQLTVRLPEPTPMDVLPKDLHLDIVYEDGVLLVVNKPKGMVVHPAPGHYDDTLVNGLLFHCKDSLSGIGGVLRPGIVHRIDRDTSGLLMVAKNDAAHRFLAEQIRAHTFLREYEAVVYGNLPQSGTVNAPLGRHPIDRKKQCVRPDGREAVTHYKALEPLKGFTHAEMRLETGRTHQIRVHMAHIGHPVAGDALYGPKSVITSLRGQALHAKTIGFVHPVTGASLQFTAAPPEVFMKFIKSKR